ncbi:putative gamma-glutamyl phosphate reductase [Ramicandelaber brevisporus]|nr:putative gamma-glutamyl phosphate reductase [Ramicandelaber brevisporus]
MSGNTTSSAVDVAKAARDAANRLQLVTTEHKSIVLRRLAEVLQEQREEILAANRADLEAAKAEVEAGRLSASLFKRLDLEGKGGEKYAAMVQGVLDVDSLPDPIGRVSLATRLDDGLDLYRVSTPVGSLLVIFEARPEVVVNIAALAIKSSNAAILKGGKEAARTNAILASAVQTAIATAKLPSDVDFPATAVQNVSTREEISALLDQDQYIDMVVPRGSKALVRNIQQSTRIPVLGHADGLCSIYLDSAADVAKAVKVVVDAKTDYPAACNAVETLLVHESVVDTVLPKVAAGLADKKVKIHADERSYDAIIKAVDISASSALLVRSEDVDYDTEFLDHEIAVKVVDSVNSAIRHINTHGSKHTDCIITEDSAVADRFMRMVDAAGVFWNASTRFADGFRYGFGAEIGISTNKTHARGPVGLEGLTIYKYRVHGNGQIAGEYGTGPGKRQYQHTNILSDAVVTKFI